VGEAVREAVEIDEVDVGEVRPTRVHGCHMHSLVVRRADTFAEARVRGPFRGLAFAAVATLS
jgi:hypothetical protein